MELYKDVKYICWLNVAYIIMFLSGKSPKKPIPPGEKPETLTPKEQTEESEDDANEPFSKNKEDSGIFM